MNLTITNAESAFLSARAKFEAWKAEFEKQWHSPANEMALKLAWRTMPPAVRAQLQALDPEKYDEIDQLMGGA